MLFIAVTGCTSAPPDTDVKATEANLRPACGTVSLQVDVDRSDAVRVTNTSATACWFAGHYPVTMNVWRLEGPGPPVATGALASRATYVQPYEAVKSNTCPPRVESRSWFG